MIARMEDFVWTCSSHARPRPAGPRAARRDGGDARRASRSPPTSTCPTRPGPFAAIMIRLPYGKTVDYCGIPEIAAHWNRKGYAFVGQDCRGTYGSRGRVRPGPSRPTRREDGHDTVAWVAEQPWSSGEGRAHRRVVLLGHELRRRVDPASGARAASRRATSRSTATTAPTATAACGSPPRRCGRSGGWTRWTTPCRASRCRGSTSGTCRRPTWPARRACRTTTSSEIVGFSQPGSRYWEYRCRREAHDAIEIPILHWCGWFDNYLGQQLRDWKRYRRLDRSGGRNFLMIGPWSHEGPPGPAERVGHPAGRPTTAPTAGTACRRSTTAT